MADPSIKETTPGSSTLSDIAMIDSLYTISKALRESGDTLQNKLKQVNKQPLSYSIAC